MARATWTASAVQVFLCRPGGVHGQTAGGPGRARHPFVNMGFKIPNLVNPSLISPDYKHRCAKQVTWAVTVLYLVGSLPRDLRMQVDRNRLFFQQGKHNDKHHPHSRSHRLVFRRENA